MSDMIINLTSLLVKREIQDFLAKYPPENFYRTMFSVPYFRNRLIAKILSNIPNRHTVVNDFQSIANRGEYLHASLEEQIKIEMLIKKYIPEILMENHQEVEKRLAKTQEKEKFKATLLW